MMRVLLVGSLLALGACAAATDITHVCTPTPYGLAECHSVETAP